MSVALEITEYELGDQPEVTPMPKALLGFLGEDGMRSLVSDHYELLKLSEIKHLFPTHSDKIFEEAKKHSADFFIQLCGGPTYFNESRGRPMMRARHAPFAIDRKARRIWLECYREVILKRDIPDEVLGDYWAYLDAFSFWMVNSPDGTN